MRRLIKAKGIQLKGKPRVPGSQHTMADKFLCVSDVAGNAELCARAGVVGWVESIGEVFGMGSARKGMRLEPERSAAVTRLTTHAFFEAVRGSARRGIVTMTVETRVGFVCSLC